MISVLLIVLFAVVGAVPVVLCAVEELRDRRVFAAEMERVWRPEPRVVRPGRVRPVLLRLRRRLERDIDLLAAEEAWHEERVREVRGELCDRLRKRDLVDARIELEGQR